MSEQQTTRERPRKPEAEAAADIARERPEHPDNHAARKPPITMTSRRNAALARRLAPGGNVFGGGTRAIPLKDPERWQLHEANGEVHDQRHYEMVHVNGWDPVLPEDLACTPDEAGYRVNESGCLVRGARGHLMLFKMPKEDYKVVEQRKTERNNAEIGRPSKVKQNVANAVANEHGSEAADYVHQHFVGTVTDTKGPLDAA